MFSHNLVNAQIGEYQITSYLGAGGMGEVYYAVHARLGREAAIKVLSHTVSNPTMLERFSNEARIQASLQHPAIAALYDYVTYNGHPCIVMEFVSGQTLDELLRTNGVPPLAETLCLFQAIVEAVAYMHKHGIVHRDIKANNIKVTATGAVKLLDFGISKSASTPQFTEVGSVIGTWQYLSPEQIFSGLADARSDVWALGVLLYELLTGALPFEATTIGSLSEKIKKAEYLTPSVLNQNVPRAVEAVLAKCLHKNAAERYSSAPELLHDVAALSASSGSASSFAAASFAAKLFAPKSLAQLLPRTIWRTHKAALLLVGTLLLVLLSGLRLFGDDGEEKRLDNPPPSSTRPLQTVRVRLFQGRAEVFQQGKAIGATPIEIKAPAHERLSLLLKCAGCKDLPITLPVSEDEEKNEFVYQMQAAEVER